MFLRTFPQMKLKAEDSGILDDLEVQEIPDTDSENSQEGDGQYLVIREEDRPCDFCDDKKRTDPDEFLSRLPDELWIEIFRDFSPFELCIIGLTCKALLRLTRTPVLWPRLCVVGDAVGDTMTLTSLLTRCSALTSLSLTARDDISELVTVLAASCHNLAHLEIKFCLPLSVTDLRSLSSGCPKLRTLNLEGTGCLNSDGDAHEMEGSTECQCGPSLSFSSLLGHFPALTELNLFHCRNLHSAGLVTISEVCHSLEKLNIDEVNYLSDESVNTFVELRGGNMKSLWLDGESLTDESFRNFHKMEKLELLSISFCDNMGSAGLRAISQLSKLEWLRLRRGAELEAEDFVAAFTDGRLAESLLHLDLSECSSLDDAGVMAVSRRCPNLGSLTLSWCWEVTDVGIWSIVSRCRSASSFLINLNLCGVVRLNGDFISTIAESLIGIKVLDLEQCPDIQLSDLQHLLTIKKDLHIKDYYGERVTVGNLFGDFPILQNLVWSSDDEY